MLFFWNGLASQGSLVDYERLLQQELDHQKMIIDSIHQAISQLHHEHCTHPSPRSSPKDEKQSIAQAYAEDDHVDVSTSDEYEDYQSVLEKDLIMIDDVKNVN